MTENPWIRGWSVHLGRGSSSPGETAYCALARVGGEGEYQFAFDSIHLEQSDVACIQKLAPTHSGIDLDHYSAIAEAVPSLRTVSLSEPAELSRLPASVTGIALAKIEDKDIEGLKRFTQLRELQLFDAQLSNRGYKQLAELLEQKEELRVLGLMGSQLGRNFRHFGALVQLQELNIRSCGLTDEDIVHVGGLGKLRALYLGRNEIGNMSTAAIGGLSNLEVLDLFVGSMSASNLDDRGIGRLGQLKKLKRLYLAGDNVSELGMQVLKQFSEMEVLDLSGRSAGPSTAAAIGTLKKLKVLRLMSPDWTDHAMRELEGLSSLEELELWETKITDASAGVLGSLTGLRQLELQSAGVGDATAMAIARLPRLQELGLASTQMGDLGVAALSKMSSLVAINLSSTQVTDLGIESLGKSKSLRKVTAYNTKADEKTIKNLETTLQGR